MSRNTKIIATLGPASGSPAGIEELARAGVDVFRLNFSHGTHGEHQARYLAVRAAEQAIGRPLAVMVDLQGPKIRVGRFAESKVSLLAGSVFRLDTDPAPGNNERVCLPHPEIFAAVEAGHALLLDDGKLRLSVLAVGPDSIETRVMVGGTLSDRKGVNLPDTALPLSAMTDKDRADVAFALALGADWIALSFVQKPEDVRELRALVGKRCAIISKLEKPQAIARLDEVIALSDALMVARGDLGVEMPAEAVPVLQRRIIAACRRAGKPVVVATQMLESMIASPTPTRAESSDVATAVYDGVDGVMLSAETAAGAYPCEAVSVMDRIIRQVEGDPLQATALRAVRTEIGSSEADAIGTAVRALAEAVPLAATVAYTTSGTTALGIAHERPAAPIIGLTPREATARRLALVWGVRPLVSEDATDVEEMVRYAIAAAQTTGLGAAGRPLAVVAGMPFGTPGAANLLHLAWLPV